MRIGYTLAGVSPIIMHNRAAGLDTRSPVSREITTIAAQKGGNRTDVDDLRLQELECQRSLYLDADCKPTLSAAALRAMIEAGARKVRQGPQVRGGLMIEPEVSFRYNVERYGRGWNGGPPPESWPATWCRRHPVIREGGRAPAGRLKYPSSPMSA